MDFLLDDTLIRSSIRLKRLLEHKNRETKEVLDAFNHRVLKEMTIRPSSALRSFSSLLRIETLNATEKYIVLEALHGVLLDLLRGQKHPPLSDVAEALLQMRFKQEKYVERALVVYIQTALLLLRLPEGQPHTKSVFKIFCTLFMHRTLINSSRCGYLIPQLFEMFLREHGECVGYLFDNEEALVACRPLLESLVAVAPSMSPALSRILLLDFLRRRSNRLVLEGHGKGFLVPLHFQLYISSETAPAEELGVMLSRRYFLEYLALQVSLRLSSSNTLFQTLDKITAAGTQCVTAMMLRSAGADQHMTEVDGVGEVDVVDGVDKTNQESKSNQANLAPERTDDEMLQVEKTIAALSIHPKGTVPSAPCTWCRISLSIPKLMEEKKALEEALYKFNLGGSMESLLDEASRFFQPPGVREVCLYLRTHPSTNMHALGRYLGKEKNKDFLEAFCSSFDFAPFDLLTALRVFLCSFVMPGEGQQIERIIYAFCEKYSGSKQQSIDTVSSVAMSLIILNTSIHNANTLKKISLEEYTTTVLKECPGVEIEYLGALYEDISSRRLESPTANSQAADFAPALLAQTHADTELWKLTRGEKGIKEDDLGCIPGRTFRPCHSCCTRVRLFLLDHFQLEEKALGLNRPAEVKNLVRACSNLGAHHVTARILAKIRDPYLVLEITAEQKERVGGTWRCFLNAVVQISQERETQSSTGLFRGLFSFSREKEKRDTAAEKDVDIVVRATSGVSDSELPEMTLELSRVLLRESLGLTGEPGADSPFRSHSDCPLPDQSVKVPGTGGVRTTKHVHPVPPLLRACIFSFAACNGHRVHLMQTLFSAAIETLGAEDLQKMMQQVPGAALADILPALNSSTLQNLPASSLFFLLEHIQGKLGASSTKEKEGAEKWVMQVLGADAARTRHVHQKIEDVALALDASGHDAFETLLKLRERISQSSKLRIIQQTRQYYKNINRVILCLGWDDPTAYKTKAEHQIVHAALLAMVSSVLEKDLQGFSDILRSCKHILGKSEIYAEAENIIEQKKAAQAKQESPVEDTACTEDPSHPGDQNISQVVDL